MQQPPPYPGGAQASPASGPKRFAGAQPVMIMPSNATPQQQPRTPAPVPSSAGPAPSIPGFDLFLLIDFPYVQQRRRMQLNEQPSSFSFFAPATAVYLDDQRKLGSFGLNQEDVLEIRPRPSQQQLQQQPQQTPQQRTQAPSLPPPSGANPAPSPGYAPSNNASNFGPAPATTTASGVRLPPGAISMMGGMMPMGGPQKNTGASAQNQANPTATTTSGGGGSRQPLPPVSQAQGQQGQAQASTTSQQSAGPVRTPRVAPAGTTATGASANNTANPNSNPNAAVARPAGGPVAGGPQGPQGPRPPPPANNVTAQPQQQNVPPSSQPQQMRAMTPAAVSNVPQPTPAAPSSANTAVTPTTAPAIPALCERCEEKPPALRCEECGDSLCAECDSDVHSKGKWVSHVRVNLLSKSAPAVPVEEEPAPPLCERCEEQASLVVCTECGTTLCDACDKEVHKRGKWTLHTRNPLSGCSSVKSAPQAAPSASPSAASAVTPSVIATPSTLATSQPPSTVNNNTTSAPGASNRPNNQTGATANYSSNSSSVAPAPSPATSAAADQGSNLGSAAPARAPMPGAVRLPGPGGPSPSLASSGGGGGASVRPIPPPKPGSSGSAPATSASGASVSGNNTVPASLPQSEEQKWLEQLQHFESAFPVASLMSGQSEAQRQRALQKLLALVQWPGVDITVAASKLPPTRAAHLLACISLLTAASAPLLSSSAGTPAKIPSVVSLFPGPAGSGSTLAKSPSQETIGSSSSSSLQKSSSFLGSGVQEQPATSQESYDGYMYEQTEEQQTFADPLGYYEGYQEQGEYVQEGENYQYDPQQQEYPPDYEDSQAYPTQDVYVSEGQRRQQQGGGLDPGWA